MATINRGILGGFSGKVGPVVGSSFRGLDVIKSKPKKSNKPPTADQEAHRQRFGLVAHFLSPLNSLIEKGYGSDRGAKSKFNLCTAYHVVNAVIGDFPTQTIDFQKVIITRGELSSAIAHVGTTNAAVIDFTWTDNSGTGLNLATDLAILVVYNPAKDLHEFAITNDARSSEASSLVVPAAFSGDTVHCWMAFISADGKLASTSSYLGTAVVD